MRKSGSFSIHSLILGLGIAVICTGILRLVLTGGLASQQKTQVTFWNGFTGPDGIVMLGIIEEFNRANPDVEVRMQRIPWGTYYNKLTVAGSDGRGPTIFVVHADALPRIRRAGFIASVDPLFEGANRIDPMDFDPYVLDRVKFGGHFAGVPLDIHPNGLFCDADMLKAAGIVNSSGHPAAPRNKAEFMKALQAMTIPASASRPDKQWGFALTAWGSNMRALMPQFGGTYLDPQGNAVLNSLANIKALTFIANLTKKGEVPPPANGLGWFGYRQKKVGMVWDGVFMLGDLKRVKTFNYIGAPIPTIGDRPGTVANSHVLCLRTGLDEKTRTAALRFIHYLSDHSIEWADAGQIPARISVRKDPKFRQMQVQYAFSKQIPWMQYPPKTPVIFEFMLIMDLAVEKAVRQTMTPKAALDEGNKAAQEVIDRDRKEHPEDQIR